MQPKLKLCAECGDLSLIYKTVGRDRYCKPCAMFLFPPKPVNKVSKKKKQEDKEYSRLRNIYLESSPYCEAKLPGCAGVAGEVHHRAGRGLSYLDVSTWIGLCRSCHSYIELHPIEAKELGFSVSRLNNKE